MSLQQNIAYDTKTGQLLKVGGDVWRFGYQQGQTGNRYVAATNTQIGTEHGIDPELLAEDSPEGNAARLALSEAVHDKIASSKAARMADAGEHP